ncbi:fungal-specific transcription factor domain-containing protein [Rostrohypoxylon terebratum]|nr:fungal-specific transcription factor domain-containing protein [Rostrohypoxylon terebratum]
MSQYPPPNSGPTRGSYMMPNQYQQPQQGYPISSSMVSQTSVATSHPQPIAPAPAARPPVLRPMPAGGVMPQPGLSSPYSGSPMMPHQQSLLQDSEQPTHVVGSQGRRGILPSAPGRPAAQTGSGASKNTVIPQKDADGKFPCPHCTKTYLHAKHLKRHLLRHTGDRPYMCVLCRDTFSRSDILKRHFQKCSIRRGNPTGVSHLSHPQAHVKKQQQNAQKANEGDMSHMNGMANMSGDNVVHPFGMVQLQDGMGNMANDQNQLSRSSSMSRMDDNGNRDRRSMTGGYNGDVSNPMTSNINPQLANFNMPPGQNGMPGMYGGSSSDWTQMFPQSGAHHAYVNQYPPNIGQNQTAIKAEPNLASERPNGIPGMAPSDVNEQRSLFFSNLAVQPSTIDPSIQLSSQIHQFFHPPGTVASSQTAGLTDFFSPNNIRNFLDCYIHFHAHFPFLHIPTFRIMEAYTGLIAATCCIGACYSKNVSASNVRDIMNFLTIALERDCDLFASDGAPTSFKFSNGKDKKDIERLQALILMSALLTWHGTPVQRESARRLFPLVADISRRFELLQIKNDSFLRSVFHQPKIPIEAFNPGQFDWSAWVEQESRVRLMYMVYLLDVARGLYFNCDPQFDSFEIQIPLPADDAAWEAQSALDCAQALSLYGPDSAKEKNPDGSQRSKQPELNLTLIALFNSSYQIHPGSTNLYGKFILIHAILAQIRRAQIEGRIHALDGFATPLSQNDWIIANGSDAGSGNASANNSAAGTPVAGLSAHTYKTICNALDKFKTYWDMDMAIQFPPSVSNPRRYGFCRDGIHFFWLAKWMIKNTTAADLQMAPDHRFRQAMQQLNSVKAWVMSDGASRGEELGSVSDIDSDYGVSNLTVDMTQLFRPLPLMSAMESPGMPTVKTEVLG